MSEQIVKKEREFHDRWATTIDVDGLQVAYYFEVFTAPENRYFGFF